jgi:gluconate 2-dehydrogenase alpha chain
MLRYIAAKASAPIIAQMNPAIQSAVGELADYNNVAYQSTHVQGGTVMGNDPTTSVVNRYCQVWGTPNVFVVGASNFPQNVGYNPNGSVGALAYWTAEAIVSRYLPGPGMLA